MTELQEAFWSVLINGEEPAQIVLLLRRQDGRLLARREELERWRLRLPDAVTVSHGGELFYSLDAMRGLSYRADESTQTVIVEAAPELFSATVLAGVTRGFAVPAPAPPGGFLNYDFLVDRERRQTHTSALVELGASNRLGVGTTSFLASDTPESGRRSVRLDSTWTSDQPERLASLRIGDSISGAGNWSRSVRFGGVQWARNFATQPGLITFPLPGVSGEAVLPSTVELYINDALRLRRDVPTGPFSIPDLPVVTGQGNARLVVRDLLGREQVIVRPYYASAVLLQHGLSDYSYEMGVIRNNFGIASSDYGRFAAVGTHRLGVTDRFTVEAHGELLRDQQTAGLSGAWLWRDVGVVTNSLAGSRSVGGSGELAAIRFERQARSISVGGNIQFASEHFQQLGLLPGQQAPRLLSNVFASLGANAWGSFGLTYTHQSYRDRENVRLASASYGVTVGKLGFLGISVLRVLTGEGKTIIGANFTRALDERTSASFGTTSQPGSRQAQLEVQRNLPAGNGLGYRLLAGAGDTTRAEAALSAQSDIGTYSVEAARSQGQSGFRASASGGVAVLGGDVFLSRRINESFAVVQVADYPNVRIYADNQLVARTGAAGTALLPQMRPYQENAIRIEQADLPLDAQVDAVKVDAVPYFRSGIVIPFQVKRSRGALIMIVLDDGEPLPAGAVAQIVGTNEEFPVAFRGEVYLTGLAANNRLQVRWKGQQCEFALPFPDTSEPVPSLGSYSCAGMKR